jgi:acetylornithine deacetylase/succinyl-diaminopimelate desuccinylase-like protein
MGWMIANRPKAFAGVGLALTEGGSGTIVGGNVAVGIEVTQKVPLWLRLEATGPAGHGSTPRVGTALGQLIDALASIQALEFEPRVLPIVDNYFKHLAPTFPPRLGNAFSDINTAIRDPGFRTMLHENFANLYALTRNTCAVTRVAGSEKINVIGPTAVAEIDCRLLPDEEPLHVLARLQAAIGDAAITIDPLLSFTPGASAADTPLYAAITDVVARHYPGVVPVPTMSNGFTDSHYLRERGIASYGFAPFLIPVQDIGGYHGNNERISIDNVDRGVELLLEIVTQVVNPESEQALTSSRR